MKNGKIIAIVGGPRSGKSFLVDCLARHYEGIAVLEGEERDFPERIREDIQKNIRPLERITWFRNKLVNDFFGQEDIKGKVISVPRDKLDFADEKDFHYLIEKIDSFKN